jgi:ABC-type sugar transport system ATPase subunit
VPPVVDWRGVYKSLGSVQAVREVALTIGSGEVMAFLGKVSTIDNQRAHVWPGAGRYR